MANLKDMLGKTTKKKVVVHLPTKRDINLALVGQKKVNVFVAIIAFVLILAAAAVFSKFAVIDRLEKVSQAEREAAELHRQVNDGYERIAGYGELSDKYAHYTYSEMTNEELSRVDRIRIIDMLERIVAPQATIGTWSVKGNQLTVSLTAGTLQEINVISGQLSDETIVDYCTVRTATSGQGRNEPQNSVTAQITVYLKSDEEVKE